MREEVTKLRAEAERCRRLAANMHHAATEKMLLKMADEYDEAAEKLGSGSKARPREGMD